MTPDSMKGPCGLSECGIAANMAAATEVDGGQAMRPPGIASGAPAEMTANPADCRWFALSAGATAATA
jgi:hypothetical protein